MSHKIISIGRECGSGGHEVGLKVASRLDIPCYDKQLVDMAARRGGLSSERLLRFDERQENPWLYEAVLEGNHHVPKGRSASSVLFKLQSDVIRNIARKASAVVIGRCSDFILRDIADVSLLTVFIAAPFSERVARKMELEHLDQKRTETLVRRTDKQRGQYYKFYTGTEWGKAEHFDLYLDKARYSTSEMVEKIILAYQAIS